MWPDTAFSVARRSIQENLQIWKFLQLLIVIVNISAEAMNQDCLYSHKKARLSAKCGLLKVAIEQQK